MKVIIKKELANLSEVDSVMDVADGYARNYLLPRGIALRATKGAVAAGAKRITLREKALEARRHEFEAMAKKLSDVTVEIAADAGEEGKLFGSVTTQDIVEAISSTAGIEVEKKKVELSAPIKMIGDYNAKIKIYKDISAQVRVKVVATPKE
ncbi:MAG: 50S ribosomal protein L9 [Candidatus Margulisiibacteriota bacterium]